MIPGAHIYGRSFIIRQTKACVSKVFPFKAASQRQTNLLRWTFPKSSALQLSTMTSQHCWAVRRSSTAAASRQQPNKTAGLHDNETQTPNKTTGEAERGRDRNENKREEDENANCWAVMEVTKKLLCLASKSVTVVGLSSYRSVSVNAVSPFRHNRVCVCVCGCARVCVCVLSRDCDQCDTFFFLLSHLFSLSLILSLRSRSLPAIDVSIPPCALKRSQTACCRKQVSNEKGQITREWRSRGEEEWKRGEKIGTDNKGRREETPENNIMGIERRERERECQSS